MNAERHHEHDDEAKVNGRARWILSLLIPLLGGVIIASVGWAIHLRTVVDEQDRLCMAVNQIQETRLATFEARQVEVMRRVGILEQENRELTISLAALRTRVGGH